MKHFAYLGLFAARIFYWADSVRPQCTCRMCLADIAFMSNVKPWTFRSDGFYDEGAGDSKTPMVWELLLSWRCKNSCGRSTEQSDNLPAWHKTVQQTKSLKIESLVSWERIDTFLDFPVTTCLNVRGCNGMGDGWSVDIMLQEFSIPA